MKHKNLPLLLFSYSFFFPSKNFDFFQLRFFLFLSVRAPREHGTWKLSTQRENQPASELHHIKDSKASRMQRDCDLGASQVPIRNLNSSRRRKRRNIQSLCWSVSTSTQTTSLLDPHSSTYIASRNASHSPSHRSLPRPSKQSLPTHNNFSHYRSLLINRPVHTTNTFSTSPTCTITSQITLSHLYSFQNHSVPSTNILSTTFTHTINIHIICPNLCNS